MLSIVWWSLFTFIGVWAQVAVPGVDFFVPGLLLCIQMEKKYHVFWMILLWSLIQDGVGGLPFGYSLLWYLSILALYRGCFMFFDVRSLMFAVLCGVLLGILHPALTALMAMLADMDWAPERYLFEGALQAFIFPLEWVVVKHLYSGWLKHEPV